MPRSLASAVVLDTWRRLHRRLRRLGSVALGLGAALVGLLGALALGAFAGGRLGGLLGPALTEPSVRRALVAGIVLPALAGGLALGATLRGPVAALGAQAAAAAASGLDRATAVLVLPLGAVLLLGAPVAVPVLLGAVSSAPSGPLGALPLATAVLAACATGGALAVLLRDGSRRARAALAVAAASLLASPTRPEAADALAGPLDAARAAAFLAPLCVASVTAWALVLLAEDGRALRTARPVALPDVAFVVEAAAAARALARRADLRTAWWAGLALGVTTAVGAHALRLPAPTGGLLATSAASLAVAPIALAAAGALGSGRHVWAPARGRASIVGAWLLAVLSLTLAPVVLTAAVEAGLARDPAGLRVTIPLCVAVVALAVIAGAVAPWRPVGGAGQAASLGILAALCGWVSLALAWIGPHLAASRLPGPVVAAAAMAALIALAGLGLARTLGEAG